MKKIYGLKRILAGCMALTMTMAAFGVSGGSEDKLVCADSENYSSRLADLKKQQEELDKQIADADRQLADEKDNLEAIKQKYGSIQKKIKNVEEYSAQLEDEMAELDGKQLDTQHSLELQEEEISKTRSEFMERIRAMYVAGGANSYTNILVNASDFYDVLMRLELVTRVAKHDNDELEQLLEQYRQLEQTRAELEDQLAKLKEKTSEYAGQQKELADKQAQLLKMEQESGDLIAKLQSSRDDLQAQSKKAADEYADVSSKAATTTTTATTAATAAEKKTTTKKTGGGGNTTTAKKTSEQTKQPESEKPSETTGTTAAQTAAPTTTTTPAPTAAPPKTPDDTVGSDSRIDTVVSYAKSMVGGSYVWGGSSFGATDCSGLVMLSFAQVGIRLPHYAASQASYGTAVSYGSMKKGDVIFFGGASLSSIYHVAIYIGDGKMVHAQNSATGIVISNVAAFSKYNNITVIKRLI